MILCVSLPAAKRFDNSSDVWSPVVACLAPNRYLVSQGCIKPLCDLLTCNDPRLVTVALEGIENVLKAGELDAQANSATNPYTTFVDEAEGLDKLEQLQARQMSGEGLVVQQQKHLSTLFTLLSVYVANGRTIKTRMFTRRPCTFSKRTSG